MSSTLKELAIALSKKQEHYVDYLTNESPILDNMRFEASTHGLWNAYEEVSKIDGAGFVDINQPLPEMEVDSSLKKIDLSILGGEIFVPEDKAAVIGVSEYFSKKSRFCLSMPARPRKRKSFTTTLSRMRSATARLFPQGRRTSATPWWRCVLFRAK